MGRWKSRLGAWRGPVSIACFMLCFAAAMSHCAAAQNAPERIVATVGGSIITESEFLTRLQLVRAQDFIISQNPVTMRSESAGQIILSSLINERLTLQWAEKTRDLPTEQEITDALEKLKQQPGIAQALASRLVTEDYLRYDIRVQRARFNIATAAITVTPAEVDAYYQKNIDRYTTPERWGLAVIRTTKRATLIKIQAQLKAGKAFGEVAQALSEDKATSGKGGSLGVVSATDPGLPVPLREAIKKLKIGETTPVVKMDYPQGSLWFFVRLLSRQAGQTTPLAEIRKQLQEQIMLERAGGYKSADEKITDYRQSVKIEINIPAYQNLLDKPKK